MLLFMFIFSAEIGPYTKCTCGKRLHQSRVEEAAHVQGWLFDGAMQPCRNCVHIVSLGVHSMPGQQEPLGCARDPIRV